MLKAIFRFLNALNLERSCHCLQVLQTKTKQSMQILVIGVFKMYIIFDFCSSFMANGRWIRLGADPQCSCFFWELLVNSWFCHPLESGNENIVVYREVAHIFVCTYVCVRKFWGLQRGYQYINHTDNFMIRQLTSCTKNHQVILSTLQQHILLGYRCTQLF